MNDLNPIIANLIKNPVFLSHPTVCTVCGSNVRLVGEHKLHGNWYCPVCAAYWPYDTLVEPIKWEKRGWRVKEVSEVILDNSPMSQFNTLPVSMSQRRPLGDAMIIGEGEDNIESGIVFPQNITTGFLVPSYGYKLKRKRRYLLAVAEDGTRTGRVKGGFTWAFDLVWKNRTLTEYNTLLAFWEAQGYASAFTYVDAIRGSSHACYFDSEIEAEASSFDVIDFSCTITE
jgi:hypothetical protein